MNKTAPRRRSLALAFAACATALTSAFAATPANAGGLVSPISGPITVDVPPSAPTTGGGGMIFPDEALISWGSAAPGTSVGPLEYHWAIFGDTCGSNWWELNNTAVTYQTYASFQATSGCTYTVGVQTFGLNRLGSYMQSGWLFFSITPGATSSAVTTTPLNLVSGVSVIKNYKGSGFTRITWQNPAQPTGIGSVWTHWAILGTSAGSTDPMWLHAGGEFGNSMMLKLTPGVTYDLYLYTRAFKSGLPVIPTGAGRIVVSFTA